MGHVLCWALEIEGLVGIESSLVSSRPKQSQHGVTCLSPDILTQAKFSKVHTKGILKGIECDKEA